MIKFPASEKVPIKVIRVPSNSTKDKMYEVVIFSDKSMSCSCFAGLMSSMCRHKRRVNNDELGIKHDTEIY